MSFKGLQAFIVSILVLTGCAASRTDVAWPEPCPLGRDITAYRPPRGTSVAPGLLESEEPTGAVTLLKALSLALMQSPGLAAVSWGVRAAEARQVQAGFRPNPELEFEVEEFGGSGGLAGFGAAESSLALSQELELGGKRARRKEVARLDRRVATWDYEAKRIDVLTATTVAFIEVLAAQERLALAEDSARLAEQTLKVISERIEAGKVSPLESMQGEVALATSRLAAERARGKLESSRRNLAAAWGSSAPTFTRAEGDIHVIRQIPPLTRLQELVASNPDVARWAAEMDLRRARVDLERANGRSNLGVAAGIQRFEESGDTAFKVGISIPLPLFGRNQGGILEARHELAKAGEERRAARVRVRAALSRAYQELSASRLEAVSLSETILPTARRAYEAAREGYRRGKFGYLEVLNAQRTLIEVGGQRIRALEAYHKAVAELERLIGTELEAVERVGEGDRPRSDGPGPDAQPLR